MSEEGATVRVKIELDLVEGKHFKLPPLFSMPANSSDEPIITHIFEHAAIRTPSERRQLLEQESKLAFIYWLDSWCKKKTLDSDIIEYIQAKVLYD